MTALPTPTGAHAEEATAALNCADFGLPGLSRQQAADITVALRTVRLIVGDIGTEDTTVATPRPSG